MQEPLLATLKGKFPACRNTPDIFNLQLCSRCVKKGNVKQFLDQILQAVYGYSRGKYSILNYFGKKPHIYELFYLFLTKNVHLITLILYFHTLTSQNRHTLPIQQIQSAII